MRLRDLDAHFLNRVTPTGLYRMELDATVEGAQGLLFQCPSCGAGKPLEDDPEHPGRRYVVGAHYIEVLFSNPKGAEPAPPECGVHDGNGGHPRWQLAGGTTLDDVSLTPSINCDIPYTDAAGKTWPSVCKFHGYVTNGEAK